MTDNSISQDPKEYFEIPDISKNNVSSPDDRNVRLQESTQEFHHYLENGEEPDLQDLLTNPKYGNKKMSNYIYEQSKGIPLNEIDQRPIIGQTTEEWVDDRHQRNKPEKALNYNFSLTNSDLRSYPDGFTKNYQTNDADIHFSVDKSAMRHFSTKKGKTCGKREAVMPRHLKTITRRNNGLRRRRKQDKSWEKALNSFDSMDNKLLNGDLGSYNPRGELADAPSDMAKGLMSLDGNPRKNDYDLLGGAMKDLSLSNFINKGMGEFDEDREDRRALSNFEEKMNDDGRNMGSINFRRILI